jgi:hypothetical protein
MNPAKGNLATDEEVTLSTPAPPPHLVLNLKADALPTFGPPNDSGKGEGDHPQPDNGPSLSEHQPTTNL